MAEELSRKRRTHGGHRSTTTRIITSAIEVLASGDLSEIAKHMVKLNQQKASLQEKRTILLQLDMEILALVDEEEIGAKIEQADLVEENIQLAIANRSRLVIKCKHKRRCCESSRATKRASKHVDRRRSGESFRRSNREWFIASKGFRSK